MSLSSADMLKIEIGKPLTEGYQPVTKGIPYNGDQAMQKGYQARPTAQQATPPSGGSSAIPPTAPAPQK